MGDTMTDAEFYAKREAETRYMRGGHLASVRCLRTGRRTQVADWILQRCAEL